MLYFKHHTKMRHDVKIKRLISKYGLEGYGLYVLILESIAEDISTESPMPLLQETCEDIAEFYNCNSAKVDEIVKYMVSQNLFSIETLSKKLACYKIYKYLEQSQTRSEKIRQLITAYKDTVDCKALVTLSQTVSDKSDRTEQNRTEEEQKKTRHKYGLYSNILLSDQDYLKLSEELTNLNDLVEKMSTWCKANGKTYKDYAAALRNWAKREPVDKPKKKNDNPWIDF
jgi:hypothetical protein